MHSYPIFLDFIYVVSLKGSLLYVAPAVTRVLGHNPADLVGKSIADLCHPADVVPLMRELKDASSGGSHAMPAHHAQAQGPAALPGHAPLFMLPTPHCASAPPPKPVHLLFRAQCKRGTGYVWLEARGRLHVEQGKGRKAIVLVGRRVDVPKLTWGALRQAEARDEGDVGVAECWGLVAPNGIVLSASPTGAQRLGFAPLTSPSAGAGVSSTVQLSAPGDPQTLVGRSLASLVLSPEERRVGEVLADAACLNRDEVRRVRCRMRVWGQDNVGTAPQETMAVDSVPVEMRFFAQERGSGSERLCHAPLLPPSLVFQMVFLDKAVPMEEGGGASQLRAHPSSPSYTLRSILQVEPMEHSGVGMGMVLPTGTMSMSDGTGSGAARALSRTPQPAHANILAELSTAAPSGLGSTFASAGALLSSSSSSSSPTSAGGGNLSTSDPSASETSWQYELTRLRFENERMREEVRRLERVGRGLGVVRERERGCGSAGESKIRGSVEAGMSSSVAVVDTHDVGTGVRMPLPPLSGVPRKRTRDGEMKRLLT